MLSSRWILAVVMLTLLCVQHVNSATCEAYQGGTSTFFGLEPHRYICCDNCNDWDTSCNGQTYQGGSSESYCSSCGETSLSGSKYLSSFDCPNCASQSSCDFSCEDYDWPGGCWLWILCFKRCCRDAFFTGKRDIKGMKFCGDSICEEGETAESCPMDCCYKVNSACTIKKGECTPECCGAPTCCLGDPGNHNIDSESSSGLNFPSIFVHIFAMMMTAFFLVF